MDRYAREVSTTKRGERWETIRLTALKREPFARIRMCDLTTQDFVSWRDTRLRVVSPGTVRREMALLAGVLSVARKEWGLISENPMTDVRKPPPTPPRERLPTQEEFERLAFAAGDDLTTTTGRAYHAFRFSCETAMRAGEIVRLTWDCIDLESRVATLPKTKNGHQRKVPLSSRAVAMLRELPRLEPVFAATRRSLAAHTRPGRGVWPDVP
jgi:integrase